MVLVTCDVSWVLNNCCRMQCKYVRVYVNHATDCSIAGLFHMFYSGIPHLQYHHSRWLVVCNSHKSQHYVFVVLQILNASRDCECMRHI